MKEKRFQRNEMKSQRNGDRTRRCGISVESQEAESFKQLSLYHAKVAQSERFLETKIHGMLGIGGESTTLFYKYLQKRALRTERRQLDTKVPLDVFFVYVLRRVNF